VTLGLRGLVSHVIRSKIQLYAAVYSRRFGFFSECLS
jgi:hypothetical protein